MSGNATYQDLWAPKDNVRAQLNWKSTIRRNADQYSPNRSYHEARSRESIVARPSTRTTEVEQPVSRVSPEECPAFVLPSALADRIDPAVGISTGLSLNCGRESRSTRNLASTFC
jgi:hypothetical protein